MRRALLICILSLLGLSLTASVAVIVHESPRLSKVEFVVDMKGCRRDQPEQAAAKGRVHFYVPGC